MHWLLKVLAIAMLIGTVGCAVNQAREHADTLYLRGDFAAWNTLEKYKVNRVGDNIYKASVMLTSDGIPYELKFTDAEGLAWMDCGYLDQKEDQLLTLGNKVRANCSAVLKNFKFLPGESGVYDFYIDFTERTPLVWVEKAD